MDDDTEVRFHPSTASSSQKMMQSCSLYLASFILYSTRISNVHIRRYFIQRLSGSRPPQSLSRDKARKSFSDSSGWIHVWLLRKRKKSTCPSHFPALGVITAAAIWPEGEVQLYYSASKVQVHQTRSCFVCHTALKPHSGDCLTVIVLFQTENRGMVNRWMQPDHLSSKFSMISMDIDR